MSRVPGGLHRRVMARLEAEGLPLIELARAHGASTGAIKSQLHRVREKLRRLADRFLSEKERIA